MDCLCLYSNQHNETRFLLGLLSTLAAEIIGIWTPLHPEMEVFVESWQLQIEKCLAYWQKWRFYPENVTLFLIFRHISFAEEAAWYSWNWIL